MIRMYSLAEVMRFENEQFLVKQGLVLNESIVVQALVL